MTKDIGAFLIGVVYLAVLFTLVRPGSQGPGLVTAVANGFTNILSAGTGGGTF